MHPLPPLFAPVPFAPRPDRAGAAYRCGFFFGYGFYGSDHAGGP